MRFFSLLAESSKEVANKEMQRAYGYFMKRVETTSQPEGLQRNTQISFIRVLILFGASGIVINWKFMRFIYAFNIADLF